MEGRVILDTKLSGVPGDDHFPIHPSSESDEDERDSKKESQKTPEVERKNDHSTIVTQATLVGGDRTWLRSGFDLYITEPGSERRLPICYTHMTMGSRNGPKTNDIYFDYPEVANRQAVFKLIQENLYFSNINPSLPTYVNDIESTFRQLGDGDEIRIGPVTMRIIKLSEAVAFLEGYTDPHRRQHWTLGQGRTTVGRLGRRANLVELNDPTVSREHASIDFSDGYFVIRPEKAQHATWVNADPVVGLKVLQDEDLIQIGQQLLRFRTYRAHPKPRELITRSATILFSDIWDYTRLAESRPLEEVIGQVNEMYKGLGRVALTHQGILMTYLGDAMMVLFDSANDLHHPLRAVRAALAMNKKLKELNADWAKRGFPTLRIGVGVATGEVMVGDVGATGHREFAAMGDTTNLAARIEKLTREHDAQVLVSGVTAEKVTPYFHLKTLGNVDIKGRKQAVEVFQVLGERYE